MCKSSCLKIVAVTVLVVIVIGGCTAFFVARLVATAYGKAIHSASGAYTRLHEYAEETGNPEYIQHAEENMAFVKDSMDGWPTLSRLFLLDQDEFDAAFEQAYETTARSIEEGENPFAYLDEVPDDRDTPIEDVEVDQIVEPALSDGVR